jgi:hypothetical protein
MSTRIPAFVGGILLALLVFEPSTHAASWTEIGDAGSVPGTAQIPTGVGALDTILGTIGFGDVDMYQIFVTGGGTFSAAASGAFPGFLDPQLYLFDSTGRGVYANDNEFPPNPFFSPGRAVLPAGHPLTPLAPGIYYLAISGIDLEPVSSGGFIFPCLICTPTAVVGSTGPGGGSPITDWSGLPFTAGSYTITLTGAEFTPPMPSAISVDIKPGSSPNSIDPHSEGLLPVAVLTTDDFDATTVDPATVRFGATGTEAAAVQAELEDVDRDGHPDLILHFKIQVTGIVCGDTFGFVSGATFSGQAVKGSDSINTVGCKRN